MSLSFQHILAGEAVDEVRPTKAPQPIAISGCARATSPTLLIAAGGFTFLGDPDRIVIGRAFPLRQVPVESLS